LKAAGIDSGNTDYTDNSQVRDRARGNQWGDITNLEIDNTKTGGKNFNDD
jgi:hypothetical protein